MKEGLIDRDIENIRKFYNDVLKNRELADILNEIEAYKALCTKSSDLHIKQHAEEGKRSDITLKFDMLNNPCDQSSSPKYGTASLSLVQSEKSIRKLAQKLQRCSPPVSARNQALITEVEGLLQFSGSHIHRQQMRKLDRKIIPRIQETELDDHKGP